MKKLTIAACLTLLLGAYAQPASAACYSLNYGQAGHSCRLNGTVGGAGVAGLIGGVGNVLAGLLGL